jgi:hypothetical protein
MAKVRSKRMRCWLSSIVLVGGLAQAVQLDAVECARIPLRESRKHAGLMFSGTVTSVQVLTVGRVIVNFDVDQVWEGRLRRATTVYTYMEAEARPFVKGHRYLVIAPKYALLEFLDKRRDAVEAVGDAVCGWGTPYEEVAHEVATLGRPRVPR